MEEEVAPQRKVNKLKIYLIAVGVFLLASFAFETGITLLENSTGRLLYPIFPFTRIALLIITILLANAYIRSRSGKPKQKLWWVILKVMILLVVAYALFMAAWFSLLQADTNKATPESAQEPVPDMTEVTPAAPTSWTVPN